MQDRHKAKSDSQGQQLVGRSGSDSRLESAQEIVGNSRVDEQKDQIEA